MNDQNFGQWLREQIESRLLTQKQFADAAGVPLGTLTMWLLNRCKPRGTNMVRLAAALGVERSVIEMQAGRSRAA